MQLQISSADAILSGGEAPLEDGRVITEMGGMNDSDFPPPRQHSRFGLQQEQDSGLAEPCSLTLR